MNVIPFATVTGRLLLNTPNSSHNNVPNVNRAYIDREMPFVSFVLMVFNACGKKDEVVQKAAARPTKVILSISCMYKKTPQPVIDKL